jgi:hypothetical protein
MTSAVQARGERVPCWSAGSVRFSWAGIAAVAELAALQDCGAERGVQGVGVGGAGEQGVDGEGAC